MVWMPVPSCAIGCPYCTTDIFLCTTGTSDWQRVRGWEVWLYRFPTYTVGSKSITHLANPDLHARVRESITEICGVWHQGHWGRCNSNCPKFLATALAHLPGSYRVNRYRRTDSPCRECTCDSSSGSWRQKSLCSCLHPPPPPPPLTLGDETASISEDWFWGQIKKALPLIWKTSAPLVWAGSGTINSWPHNSYYQPMCL